MQIPSINSSFFFYFLLVIIVVSCKTVEPKPNVIFILTDQWRASALGYNGDTIVQTPYLDQFSESAVNFRNAVSVTPVCTPYRAALMTGRYPTSTGMFINDLYLPPEELTMAEIFKNEGYQTAYLGKWHLDGHGRTKFVAPERRQGWSDWKAAECDHNYLKEHYYENEDTTKRYWEGYSTFAIAEDAQSRIEQYAKEENPFFLFVSLATPHFPHNTAPQQYKDLYPIESLTLPPNVPEGWQQEAKEELQGYYAHCTATDKAIGDIIAKLKERGIYENSIIVFTSDHGEMMGSHDFRPYMKHQPFSEASNVPFLISFPEMDGAAGASTLEPITTPDILPSLLGLSNLNIPTAIEGYNLARTMRNPGTTTDHSALYMNICPFGMAYEPTTEYRAIRTSKFTYVKTPEGPSMLYDNTADPYQMVNLVDSAAYSSEREFLDQKLLEELARIGEESIEPRDYYLKKFAYFGRPEFRVTYHIDDVQNVRTVITPYKSIDISSGSD